MNNDDSLVLKNYKEPLIQIPKAVGYGYYGAILVTLDGEKMQCHVCGKLFGDVGIHARQAHSIAYDEYRDKYQLARGTSLISEAVRGQRKDRTLRWLASLTPEQKEAYKQKGMKAYLKWRKEKGATARKITLETKNKRGTCPDQLLAKIHEVAATLGHTPSLREFIGTCGTQRYKHLIFTTFGSWEKAVKKAGLVVKARYSHPIGTKAVRYTDEELLDYLSIFYTEQGKIPTETDYHRGFIPNTDLYRRRFGSIAQARELAGIRE